METEMTEEEELERNKAIYEYRADKLVDLQCLVSRTESTDKWRWRQRVGTLLNEIEELCGPINSAMDRRDFLDAADSMLDVREKIAELSTLLATNTKDMP